MDNQKIFQAIDQLLHLSEKYVKELQADEKRKDEKVIVIDHADLSERFMAYGMTDSYGLNAWAIKREMERIFSLLNAEEKAFVEGEIAKNYAVSKKQVEIYEQMLASEKNVLQGLNAINDVMQNVNQSEFQPNK